jgi:hypothetical protein
MDGTRCSFSIEGTDIVLVKRNSRWLLQELTR